MEFKFQTGLTMHALKRSQQRAIRPWAINFVLDHADKFKNTRKGTVSQFISEKKINRMVSKGQLKPSDAKKLKGIVVIDYGKEVITVFHKQGRLRN